jgi:4-hydroxybenzoate polyprenyltransferase
MDNLITGLIALAVFLTFVLGLAESIGTIPFTVIVVAVSGMIAMDYYQSAKQGLEKEKNKNAVDSSQR